MQIFICKACGRRTIYFEAAETSCSHCGAKAGGISTTKVGISLDHSDFDELGKESLQPREDLNKVELSEVFF
jgi:hypothetical protein